MPTKTRTKIATADQPDPYAMRFEHVPYIQTDYNDSSPYRKSVEDVTEETRYILEEFIIERATEDGVDMGLMRPIIDINLTALPQYRQIQQIARRLRMIGDELDADQRIKSMVDQVPVNSPYETFSDVAKELFCDGIYNWGRIVTLFFFTYKLIIKSLRDQPASILQVLVDWTVRFVKELVAPWIVGKGGWLVILRDAVPQSRLTTLGIFLSGMVATIMVLYFYRRI
ncbi:unnamed protein product [Rotaria socialis]|uniref:Bcl-2 Bcl-2 homology region 1-3 domain-containing protein n=1 Tax=Rotaria socialis TaxID=392032 RepID=A0A818BDS3_9BILA|nr:unnamed protein product [Rotaria socialis]CAF3383004.1 unnamed protein product [Rotaria socialis]CAF3403566.1 unnamed protein product [Rotaria socialis]CAF3416493.1 unnamed protein product [Rotaria socialis]CAF3557183.1 unnamed protein product [Rotaria socialis]